MYPLAVLARSRASRCRFAEYFHNPRFVKKVLAVGIKVGGHTHVHHRVRGKARRLSSYHRTFSRGTPSLVFGSWCAAAEPQEVSRQKFKLQAKDQLRLPFHVLHPGVQFCVKHLDHKAVPARGHGSVSVFTTIHCLQL